MLDIVAFLLEVEEFLSQCLYCQLFSLHGNLDLYLLERVLPLLFAIADFIKLLRVVPAHAYILLWQHCSSARRPHCSSARTMPEAALLLSPEAALLLSPEAALLLSPEAALLLSPEATLLLSPEAALLLSPEATLLLSPEAALLLNPEAALLLSPEAALPLTCGRRRCAPQMRPRQAPLHLRAHADGADSLDGAGAHLLAI
jgi:hypothetical protein